MIIVLLIAAGAMLYLSGIIGAVAVFGGYLLGVLGWAQIIGSLRYIRMRGAKASFLTIMIWLVILGAASFAVYAWLNKAFLAYLVGLAISFITILFQKEIK